MNAMKLEYTLLSVSLKSPGLLILQIKIQSIIMTPAIIIATIKAVAITKCIPSTKGDLHKDESLL